MATRIANTLIFTNLAPGASVVLVHDLNNGNIKQAADIITLPSPQLVVLSSTNQSITIKNQGPSILSGAVLAEWINTPNRAFGNSGNIDLSVKPYIVVGSEIAGSPPQPPFTPQALVVYARLTGNDTTGDGTLANPYRTFQRAIRDVPNFIPPGTHYTVDVTGIGLETLPNDFVLPSWKSAVVTHGYDFANPYFYALAAVRLSADPQLAAALTAPQATIEIADGVWNPPNLINGFLSLTDTSAPGWPVGGLKGKFVKGEGSLFDTAVIYDNTADTLFINQGPFPLTLPVRIMEPSATLESNTDDPTGFARAGIYAAHEDSIALAGLRIKPVDFSGAVSIQSASGVLFCELCELIDHQLHEGEYAPEYASCNVVGGTVNSSWFGITSRFSGGTYFGLCQEGGGLGNVFDGCLPVGSIGPSRYFGYAGLIKNGLSDGFSNTGLVELINYEISDCAGNGIFARGPTRVFASGVGGDGNGGVGIKLEDGAQVLMTTTGGFDGIFMRVAAAIFGVTTRITTTAVNGVALGDQIIPADVAFVPGIPDPTPFPGFDYVPQTVVNIVDPTTFDLGFDTTGALPYVPPGGAVFLPVKTTVTGADDQQVGNLAAGAFPASGDQIADPAATGPVGGTNSRLFNP